MQAALAELDTEKAIAANTYTKTEADGLFQVIVAPTWTNIASASVMDVAAVSSPNLRVTGTTTVNSLGSTASGITRTLTAVSGFQLTHSSNIICPGSANIVLAINDYVVVSSLGAGIWHVTSVLTLATATAPGLMSVADKTKLASAPVFVPVAGVSTASGTAFDFTGLPSDTARISLQFFGVSLSGTDNMLIQIGDSGGFETSGYNGAGTGTTGDTGATITNSDGFVIRIATAAEALSGIVTLERYSTSGSTSWVCSYCLGGSVISAIGGGVKTLSDVLTQVRLTRTGSDTFDAGAISMLYERAS